MNSEVSGHMCQHYYPLIDEIYRQRNIFVQFMFPKERNKNTMPRCKRFYTKM